MQEKRIIMGNSHHHSKPDNLEEKDDFDEMIDDLFEED